MGASKQMSQLQTQILSLNQIVIVLIYILWSMNFFSSFNYIYAMIWQQEIN